VVRPPKHQVLLPDRDRSGANTYLTEVRRRHRALNRYERGRRSRPLIFLLIQVTISSSRQLDPRISKWASWDTAPCKPRAIVAVAPGQSQAGWPCGPSDRRSVPPSEVPRDVAGLGQCCGKGFGRGRADSRVVPQRGQQCPCIVVDPTIRGIREHNFGKHSVPVSGRTGHGSGDLERNLLGTPERFLR
jgi:hypothetical protein